MPAAEPTPAPAAGRARPWPGARGSPSPAIAVLTTGSTSAGPTAGTLTMSRAAGADLAGRGFAAPGNRRHRGGRSPDYCLGTGVAWVNRAWSASARGSRISARITRASLQWVRAWAVRPSPASAAPSSSWVLASPER